MNKKFRLLAGLAFCSIALASCAPVSKPSNGNSSSVATGSSNFSQVNPTETTTIPSTTVPSVPTETPSTTVPETTVPSVPTETPSTTVPGTTVPSVPTEVPSTTVPGTTAPSVPTEVPSTTVPGTTVPSVPTETPSTTVPGTTVPSVPTETPSTTIPGTIVPSVPTETPSTSTGSTSKPSSSASSTSKPSTTKPSSNSDKVTSTVSIIRTKGYLESCIVEWAPLKGAEGYNVYYKKKNTSNYKLVDKELTRGYGNYYRADIVGLSEGEYDIKVVPVKNNSELNAYEATETSISVLPNDRSGFAFKNGTSSGAYKDNGELRDDANVIYITEANKDSIKLDVTTSSKGAKTTATGIVEILAAYKKNYEKKPLNIRVIGKVTNAGNITIDKSCKGDIAIDGTTMGVTIEGIGSDATAYGWGVRVKNAVNVEIRNLGFMMCSSSEGDNVGLQQDNKYVWVHNCDMFYGAPGGDKDQVKGDGALDCKKSTNVTFSYNHFYDNGKCNLLGLSEGTTEDLFITYHHNWYDHSDSRHPRVRYYSAHVYNNYYDGNAKYGIGACLGSSIFSENNYFNNCKYPMLTSMQGNDVISDWNNPVRNLDLATFSKENGGSIKAFGNYIVGGIAGVSYQKNNKEFDYYLASSKDEKVPDSVKSFMGENTYNNFDTNPDVFYDYILETAQDAKNTVMLYSGRVEGGDFSWRFTEADDTSYVLNEKLAQALKSYKSSITEIFVDNASIDTPAEDEVVDTVETYQVVINKINALPEVSNITLSDKALVNEAKTKYDSLSEEDKNKVTNYNKLLECLHKLEELSSGTQIISFENGLNSNPYFTVTGSLKSGIAPKEYNGVTYKGALKLDSAGSVSFIADKEVTITIISELSKSIKIDETKYTPDENGILVLKLSAGSHTLVKGDSNNIYAIIVE